ncbi:hypothetical protein [Hoeflea sp. BAL378]|uniref:hypothetical protein n=1 Tax=Hoeflea sp. BAL378 TaxID=1547437 RepID=UPI0005541B85|nr:hypothetical protein [Hoeflea sp. BAL378]
MINADSKQFIQAYDAAIRAGVPFDITYSAKLLLPGSDASIIVDRERITISIDDAPVPGDHPMSTFIEEHEFEIRDVTSGDLGVFTEIVMAGRWHNHETEMQGFEPYLVCKTDEKGNVSTATYKYDFFGYGGGGHSVGLNSHIDGWSAHRVIMAVTARLTDYSNLSPGLPKTLGLPTGAVWYPPAGLGLPCLVMEHANEQIAALSA